MKYIHVIFLGFVLSMAGFSSSAFSEKQAASHAIKPELLIQYYASKDSSLYMLPRDVSKEMELLKNGVVLVDVRRASQYTKCHIQGSLNIPAHFIKTKPFLNGKMIVLIDLGTNTQYMERNCRALIDEGFNAFILEGGLSGLVSIDSPIPIQSFGPVDFSSMTQETFFTEKNYNHYLIIDTSLKQSELSKEIVPYAVHIPLPSKSVSTKKKIKDNMGESTVVIILNSDGTMYQAIRKQFETWQVKPVFFLEGGVQAYAGYLKNVTRSLRPENERKVTGPGCASCRKNK